MKALVVHPGPNYSVADVYKNIVAGLLANGVEVAEHNLDARLNFYMGAHVKKDGVLVPAFGEQDAVLMAAKGLEVACYEWWPDVVILVSGFFIPPQVLGVLALRPHHVVLWCTEAPYEDDRHQRLARYVDTVIVNDPVSIDTYRAVNPRTWYMPHMWNPALHVPCGTPPQYDFGWVGTGFKSRIEFFEACDFGDLDVRLGGNWQELPEGHPLDRYLIRDRTECMHNEETVELYQQSKTSMNWYRKEVSEHGTSLGWAVGPREVELAATGTFFLREARGEGDGLFPMLPTFETPAEFSDKLAWWCRHDTERDEAATAALAAVADRSNDQVMARFVRLVDGVPKVFQPSLEPVS